MRRAVNGAEDRSLVGSLAGRVAAGADLPHVFLVAWCAMALLASAGGLLWWKASRRLRVAVPLREAAPGRRVSDLSEGRFRVVGSVVAVGSQQSSVDGADCVCLERADYRTVLTEFVPLLREVERQSFEYPFLVDDGTGQIWIDPAHSVINTRLVRADQGLTAERRLVAGEEVEVVASFAPRKAASGESGPYRHGSATWEAVDSGEGPPSIVPTATATANPPVEETIVLQRGLALLLIVAGAVFGVAATLAT